MKIFIDSADLAEIQKYLSWGLCDGVTTNPTIYFKCGVTGSPEAIKKRTVEIAKLISPRPVSVEVATDAVEQIVAQAREYSRWAKNIVVKVTVTDTEGRSLLPAVYRLVNEAVKVNITAITTFNQAILTAKAIVAGPSKSSQTKGPNFISIFGGRISEEHGIEQAAAVIKKVRQWLDFYKYEGVEIIVGSVRSRENVEFWSQCGAHVLTIPPHVIADCLTSARTTETVVQFINDAHKSLAQITEKKIPLKEVVSKQGGKKLAAALRKGTVK